MAVSNYNQYDFGTKLSEVLSPSQPVKSIEHLIGRDVELEVIERALFQVGRHVFIFGDRGVGKSSLAATAAMQYQSSDGVPIAVSGSPDDTFKSIIAHIATQALGRSRIENTKTSDNLAFEWRGVKVGGVSETSPIDIASQIETVGDAVLLLKEVSVRHSQKPVVILDEFDMISDPYERNKFANLLKQLGDQSVNLKFIFTGIGKSLDELLGAHQSSFRQLATVELLRLPFEARREIVLNSMNAFGLTLNDNVNWRIALISDGYPYYVHLIAEHMLWAAFDDDKDVGELSWSEFHTGLRKAISSVSAELRKPYETAVFHRDSQYERIIWATSDGDDLWRPVKSMYSSYKLIMDKLGLSGLTFDSSKFNDHVRKLKTKSFGEILEPIPNRNGWYIYKEKMLRGFVRMQAEANGVELTGEQEAPKQKIHIPGSLRTGYRGSSVPRGVRLSGDNK
jgi:uncharacterized protein